MTWLAYDWFEITHIFWDWLQYENDRSVSQAHNASERKKIITIKWKLGNQLTQTFVPFNVFPSEKWAHNEQRLQSEGNVGKPKNQNELLCFRWWNWNQKTRINTIFFETLAHFPLHDFVCSCHQISNIQGLHCSCWKIALY